MRNAVAGGIKLAATLVVVGVVVAGCLSNDTGDGAVRAPSNPVIGTVLNGFVQDGRSLNGLGDVSVTVAASDQSKVVPDADGDYTFTDDDGSVSFALKESVVPSEDNPVSITLVTRAGPGYVDSSTVVIVSEPGEQSFVVNMVALAAPPDGVRATQKAFTGAVGSNGATQQEMVISAGTQATDAATVTVPEDTTITDAKGEPLTGDLTVNVVHHDNIVEDALETFPGTLTATFNNPGDYNASNPPNQASSTQGNFISGGFTSITMTDASGKTAKHLNTADPAAKPMQVRVNVAADTLNPDTGEPVKVGDEFPIWSYENDRGVWTYEATGIVQSDASGLFVTYNTNHLSYWNLDWFQGKSCKAKLRIANGGDRRLRIRLARVGGGFVRTVYYTHEGDVLNMSYVPAGMKLRISVFDDLTGEERKIIDPRNRIIDDFCEEPRDYTVTLEPEEEQLAKLTVTVLAVCSNGTAEPKPLPSASVNAFLGRKLVNHAKANASGVAILYGLPTDETYRVVAKNNAKHTKATKFIEIDSDDLTPSLTIEVPEECEPGTGATGTGGTGATGAGGSGI
jgi:hypothetical protein